MSKLIFDGYNHNEIAEKTGLKVTDGIGTVTANCSEQHPEGFDYPYVAIHTDKGVVNVRVTTEVPENLVIN